MDSESVPEKQSKNPPAAGEALISQQLIDALAGNSLSPEQRTRYAEQLLRLALDTRDASAAVFITRLMDHDTALDEHLNRILNEALETRPDAVYFVIRSRLSPDARQTQDSTRSDAIETEHRERWLPRLQMAAVQSLRVAINDSDTATLNSWLTLIVREPAAYGLGDVLRQGILAAQERTHDDGAFGLQLLLLAAKRSPDLLDMLLNDEALVAALPDEIARAVHDYQPEAVETLLAHGRGLYLATLARAAEASHDHFPAVTPGTLPVAQVFTPNIVQKLWDLYQEVAPPFPPLPERFQPVTVLNLLVSGGVHWLPDDALTRLLLLLLTHTTDPVFGAELPTLIKSTIDRNPALLLSAINTSGLTPDTILNLIGNTVNSGALTPQQSIRLYLQMLEASSWQRTAAPIAEQIARTIQQQPALTLIPERIWKLLTFAAEARIEFIARVMTRRLIADLEKIDNDRTFADQFLKLSELTGWNSSAKQIMLNWWRDFIRQQPLGRLQQLEKALDNKKTLDEPRTMLTTIIALRKVFGKRSLGEFAEAIGSAFNVLQALADSFDPEARHIITLDQATLRAELDAHDEEITPDERRVLAKNLKELGLLIADMAEHRSRATLIRREEEVERQLMTGEQQPQSAIDMMKWLSGYLEGAQDESEDES